MSLLGNSYQFDSIIKWWQDGPFVHIADQYGSFVPMPVFAFERVVILGIYARLVTDLDYPGTNETLNYAVKLYCRLYSYNYISLN